MYFPFNYFFLITQVILLPKVKSLQSEPACLNMLFFVFFFFLCRLLEGSEMCFKKLKKDFELKIQPAMWEKPVLISPTIMVSE